MYALSDSQPISQKNVVNNSSTYVKQVVAEQNKKVADQLRSLGVSWLALKVQEFKYLPRILHPDETILGVVYGKNKEGFAILVATDKRTIYLDTKPLFINEDELTYDVVSGVKFSTVGIGCTVTLHTRIKDYTIKTLNEKCARGFVSVIEKWIEKTSL
jgi:hypothetical protein